jgi:hypothetical protein
LLAFVIARRELLRSTWAALAWPLGLAAHRAHADALGEAFADLEQRTREYQDSLARLLTRQKEALARAEAAVERYRHLRAAGLVARRDVEEAEHAEAEARGRVEETQKELTDSERLATEARGLEQLAALPPVAPGEEKSTPEALEHGGATPWTLAQVTTLQEFFLARFGRPLPVSAMGQTPLHDRLGFDHRNAIDVAVHPDSGEGHALLDHLRSRGIPFLAFRGPIVGASTGAHVHIGAPSPRTG